MEIVSQLKHPQQINFTIEKWLLENLHLNNTHNIKLKHKIRKIIGEKEQENNFVVCYQIFSENSIFSLPVKQHNKFDNILLHLIASGTTIYIYSCSTHTHTHTHTYISSLALFKTLISLLIKNLINISIVLNILLVSFIEVYCVSISENFKVLVNVLCPF